jgi:superfamily II DNA or RNA helicase
MASGFYDDMSDEEEDDEDPCGNKCTEDEICNPKTSKCVKKTGRVGKALLSGKVKSPPKSNVNIPCIGCKETEICNPVTGKCVKKTGRVGIALLKKGSPKVGSPKVGSPKVGSPKCVPCKAVCKEDEICNPASGKCVKRTGRVGKALLGGDSPKGKVDSSKGIPCKAECKPEEICNPASGKCVKRSGRVGKALLGADSPKVVRPESPSSDSSSSSDILKNCESCKPDEICNKVTGKCVKRTGKIGKAILDGTYAKPKKLSIKSFEPCKGVVCPEDRVCNPLTKKCVLKKGALGQNILRQMATLPEFKKKRSSANCIEKSQVKLHDYQIRTVEVFNKQDSLLVVHEPGMGKTLTAIACAECYLDQHPKSNVVVITMVSLLGNFDKEFKKYGGIDANRYVFISYETFLSEHKRLKKKSCDMFKDALLIIDEVHELRNYESSVFESIMDCIGVCNKVLLLTATPYVNGCCDFISIINLLYKKYVVSPSTTSAVKIATYKVYKAHNKIKGCSKRSDWWKPAPSPATLLKQIRPFLEDKVSFATKGVDNVNYPREEINTILIPMNPAYEKEFLAVVPAKAIEDPFYGLRRQKVNALDRLAYSDKLKNPQVLAMIQNPENKNVIFSSWLEHGVEFIEDVLAELGIEYSVISGDVTARERTEIVKDFNEDRVHNLIITTAGMAGIDLVGVTNIIVVDPVWNDGNLRQIIGRGVRYRSHSHLPVAKRVVHVYLLKLVEKRFAGKEGDIYKPENMDDINRRSRSGDIILYKIIERKRTENDLVLNMLREISVV